MTLESQGFQARATSLYCEGAYAYFSYTFDKPSSVIIPTVTKISGDVTLSIDGKVVKDANEILLGGTYSTQLTIEDGMLLQRTIKPIFAKGTLYPRLKFTNDYYKRFTSQVTQNGIFEIPNPYGKSRTRRLYQIDGEIVHENDLRIQARMRDFVWNGKDHGVKQISFNGLELDALNIEEDGNYDWFQSEPHTMNELHQDILSGRFKPTNTLLLHTPYRLPVAIEELKPPNPMVKGPYTLSTNPNLYIEVQNTSPYGKLDKQTKIFVDGKWRKYRNAKIFLDPVTMMEKYGRSIDLLLTEWYNYTAEFYGLGAKFARFIGTKTGVQRLDDVITPTYRDLVVEQLTNANFFDLRGECSKFGNIFAFYEQDDPPESHIHFNFEGNLYRPAITLPIEFGEDLGNFK